MNTRELPPNQLDSLNSQEAAGQLHSLDGLKRMLVDFELDRPTLGAYHKLHPVHINELTFQEIGELNGPDEDGFFAQPENVQEHRQQEVSDIVIFTLDLYDQLAEQGGVVFSDEAKILELAANIAGEYGIAPVSRADSSGEPREFGPEDDAIYKKMLTQLNQSAKIINPEYFDPWQALPNEAKEAVLNQIMANCYAIFYLLGLDPVSACEEKVARNHLKYPAELLQDDFSYIENDPDMIDFLYIEAMNRCKDQFDGPKDEKGKRPQDGTKEFYVKLVDNLPHAALQVMSENKNDGTVDVPAESNGHHRDLSQQVTIFEN